MVGREHEEFAAAQHPIWDRPIRLRSFRLSAVAPARRAEAREASEGWWARQDSNLQPDRYERPALTIELQAPPRGRPRGGSGRRRCAVRLQGRGEGCNGGGAGAAYAAAAPCEFQITEIRDAACIPLFCPTVQPAAGRGRVPRGCLLVSRNPLEFHAALLCMGLFLRLPFGRAGRRGRRRRHEAAASPPRRRRTPPPCATSRSRRPPACRTRPGSSAWGCRRSRRGGRPAWGPSAPH